MNHNVLKAFKALCVMVVVLALFMAGITTMSAYAADNGIYIATATPHYRNPQTGVIEDSGGDGSYVLGQSMTESATYRKALVEVDASGNTYITVRLQLMDNIQNPQFQVDGSPVTATLMQEDYINNTADYRMKVNSENSIVRCNMNVIAMGRDVIFYITFSNLQDGSGDFITSITVDKSSNGNSDNSSIYNNESTVTKASDTENSNINNSGNDNGEQAVNNSGDDGAETNKSDVSESGYNNDNSTAEMSENSNIAQEDGEAQEDGNVQTDQSVLSENVSAGTAQSSENVRDTAKTVGLEEYDESGNKVSSALSDNTQTEQSSSFTGAIIIIVIIILAAVGGTGYYIYKKRNEE